MVDLICANLLIYKGDFKQNILVITGSDPVPIEINCGVVIQQQDMRTSHEVAGTITVQQVELLHMF